ncbi:MAG: class I SAM-dependent methyltransferase [Desulfovibrionaceae bacterium]|nr:class I SAM-dependent methyltransferase [Desulfovibrionaceae bacterium]
MNICPLCGNRARPVYVNPEAYFADRDLRLGLEVAACAACGFLFQSSAFSDQYQKVMKTAYQTYYDRDIFAFPRRDRENKKALDMVLRHLPADSAASVLEVGSNRGDLLYMLKEQRPECNVLGVDPGQSDDRGVPTIRRCFSPDLFASRFDVVILKHILEHFTDPKGFAAQVSTVLKEDGFLYLDVPNVDWILKEQTEGFVLHHIGYFNLGTLCLALEGFEPVAAQEEASLRAVFRRGRTRAPALRQDFSSLAESCKKLEHSRRELVGHIKRRALEGKKVVFYGAYTIFRLLYRELKAQLAGAVCHYFDDSFTQEREPVFGLPRQGRIDRGSLVVLCSNNSQTLDAMNLRVSGTGAEVVRPWRGA